MPLATTLIDTREHSDAILFGYDRPVTPADQAPAQDSGFRASIEGDAVDHRLTWTSNSYERCASDVRHLAQLGETITVTGPRGGVKRFKAVGEGPLATVWEI
jgi:hypothetical protein